MTSIHDALIAIRSEVGALSKSDTNKQQGYSFWGRDLVINNVSPLFDKHGVMSYPEVIDLAESWYETKSGTPMHYARVTVRWTFEGPDGDTRTCVVVGAASDAADKAWSQAQTVAERLALIEVLQLRTGSPDPDEQYHERAPRRSEKPAVPSDHVSIADGKKMLLKALGGDKDAAVDAWDFTFKDAKVSVPLAEVSALCETYAPFEASGDLPGGGPGRVSSPSPVDAEGGVAGDKPAAPTKKAAK